MGNCCSSEAPPKNASSEKEPLLKDASSPTPQDCSGVIPKTNEQGFTEVDGSTHASVPQAVSMNPDAPHEIEATLAADDESTEQVEMPGKKKHNNQRKRMTNSNDAKSVFAAPTLMEVAVGDDKEAAASVITRAALATAAQNSADAQRKIYMEQQAKRIQASCRAYLARKLAAKLRKQREEKQAAAVISRSARNELARSVYSAMSKDVQKRTRKVKELYDTEANYVQQLQVLIDVFYDPLLNNDLLPSEVVLAIFSNVKKVVDVNAKFLASLKRRLFADGTDHLHPNVRLGDLFIKELVSIVCSSDLIT